LARFRHVALGLIAGLLLAGCGFGSSSSTPTGAGDELSADTVLTDAFFEPGLMGAEYDGYFDDDVSFFEGETPVDEPAVFTHIDIAGHDKDFFSWQWTGYFRPDQTGEWKIRFSSDDAAYIWIGSPALSGFTTDNALAKAPGIHGPMPAEGSVDLAADLYYPLRIQFGDATNYEKFEILVVRPDGSVTSRLDGYFWHNPGAPAPDFGIRHDVAALALAQIGVEPELAVEVSPDIRATSTVNLDPKQCMAPRTTEREVGFGFPRPEILMASSGNIRGLMIFVEFNDVKGTDNPLEVGPKFTRKFEEFYAVNSYGALQVEVDILPDYYLIPKDSGSYGMNTWNGGDPGAYFGDGIRAADADVDFGEYDFVVVMPPSGISRILYGPAFPYFERNWQNLPRERDVYRGVVGGADQRNQQDFTGWIWLAHEVGHILGMEHQYNNFDRPAPVWDLMDNVYIDLAPGLFAWHRYQMGWLTAPRLACFSFEQAQRGISLPLSSLDDQGDSLKSVMVRLTEYKVLVIEARLESPFDKLSAAHQGILAYVVDTSLSGFANPVKLAVKSFDKNFQGQPIGTLSPGESVDVEGFTVENLGVEGSAHWVSVTPN
jgi:M6 family metalloprotease-like protein